MEPVFHLVPEGRTPQAQFADFVEHGTVVLTVDPQRVDDVLVDAHREGVWLLKHHAHALPQFDDVHAGIVDRIAIEPHVAGGPHALHEVIKTVHAPQERRFPAATGTDEGRHLVVRNRHRDAVERLLAAIPEIEPVDLENGRLLPYLGMHFGGHVAAGGDSLKAVAGNRR